MVLHRALGYDLGVWLLTFGREWAFRGSLLKFAALQPGETVLDVGCGTGTLAIVAKQQVGPAGTVCGVDASPEMVARASRKARRAGVDVGFQRALAQALPFPDGQFDAVLSTVMVHHLPRPARAQMAVEIRRVLKPGGRVLVVDFGKPAPAKKRFLPPLHRHGQTDVRDIGAVLSDAGLSCVAEGTVGMHDLYYVTATRS